MPVIERFTPGRWVPPWLRHQHIARYKWAGPLAAGRRVLDVACGSGYGARMLLAAGAAAVDGYDIDTESITEARRAHPLAGLRFEVGDATRLPVPDAAYDLIVSFETIEHVRDDAAYVREMRRVLRPGGVFVCTTPNRIVTNPGTRSTDPPFNRFHVREYTADELRARLGECFPAVELSGQAPFDDRYVGLLARLRPRLAFRVHQAVKCLGLPWESFDRHVPRAVPPGYVPEVLVAVCRTGAGVA